MGNIGTLSSIGKLDNSGSGQELKTISFYNNLLNFEAKCLQIDDKIYNPDYQIVAKSGFKRLPIGSTSLPSNPVFPVFADFGKIYQKRFANNSVMYIDALDTLTGSVTSKQYVDNTVNSSLIASKLVKIGNDIYLAEFAAKSSKVTFCYHIIGKTSGSNFYDVKGEYTDSTSVNGAYPALYDCATGDIFYINSNRRVYKYDFNSNTYTLITTLPAATRLGDCVYNNVLYSITNTGYLTKFNLSTSSSFENVGRVTSGNFTFARIVAGKGIIVGGYNANGCDTFYYDIDAGILNTNVNVSLTYEQFNVVNMVNFDISLIVCYTTTNTLTYCSSVNTYNLTNSTSSVRLVGIVDE